MKSPRVLEFSCEFSEMTRSGHSRVVGSNFGAPVRVGDRFSGIRAFAPATRLRDRLVHLVPGPERLIDLLVHAIAAYEPICEELPSGIQGQLILDVSNPFALQENDRLTGEA